MRTRAALRDALLSLLEQKSFDQITIRDITASAGAGYATFFRHYETKNSLLDDLAKDEVQTLINLAFPVLVEANSRAAARAICVYVDKSRVLWTALLTGGAAGTMREEFNRQARLIPVPPSPELWLPHRSKSRFWYWGDGRGFGVVVGQTGGQHRCDGHHS